MKKRIGIIGFIVMLSIVMLFTGCANEVKYGNWKLAGTAGPR